MTLFDWLITITVVGIVVLDLACSYLPIVVRRRCGSPINCPEPHKRILGVVSLASTLGEQLSVMVVSCCIATSIFISGIAHANIPHLLRLPTGESVIVLGVKKVKLDHENEPALALIYQTDKDIENTKVIAAEVENVWLAFMPMVENKHFNLAVVAAREPPGIGVNRTIWWHWKRNSDGQWHRT